MNDASTRAVGDEHDRVRAELTDRGYALTNDEAIGLPEKFRENFERKYFNDKTLHRYEGDWPRDRKRARDVILYQWRGDGLHLKEYDKITITDRAGIVGKRDHIRVMFLNDPQSAELVRTFLNLVPPDRRQSDGTFGVNFFRTYTNVVTTPHRDYEEFCIFYVVKRAGGGAETYLYDADVPGGSEAAAEPVFWHRLEPGEIIIFDDRRFKHGATPLETLLGGTAERDALVCTVDYPETYLTGAAENDFRPQVSGSPSCE